jgi:chromate transporter
MRAAVVSSVAPPNIIVPRHSGETFTPLRPKERYSIPRLLFPLSTLHQTGFNAAMGNRSTSGKPALASLFVSFVSIGMMSVGGGLSAWTRLEVVQKKAWLDDKQFLSGYALSQLVPGATNVNLAVFIGTQLRGTAGALACLFGLVTLPVAIVLVLGALYLHSQGHTGGARISAALGGMGAVAIGLNLGTGVRLARRNISGLIPIAVTAVVTLSIGVFGFALVHVLLVMMPVSLLLAWLTRPR